MLHRSWMLLLRVNKRSSQFELEDRLGRDIRVQDADCSIDDHVLGVERSHWRSMVVDYLQLDSGNVFGCRNLDFLGCPLLLVHQEVVLGDLQR